LIQLGGRELKETRPTVIVSRDELDLNGKKFEIAVDQIRVESKDRLRKRQTQCGATSTSLMRPKHITN